MFLSAKLTIFADFLFRHPEDIDEMDETEESSFSTLPDRGVNGTR